MEYIDIDIYTMFSNSHNYTVFILPHIYGILHEM